MEKILSRSFVFSALISIALLILTGTWSVVPAQNGPVITGQNFTIYWTPYMTTTYKASEFVDFVNGAAFQADQNKQLHALIDPYMIFPPATGVTGGPNTGDAGVVGSLEGQATVGQMGNFIYSIPIKLPECVPGMTPNLSLVYNSAGNDDYMGHGWSLGGLSSISRVPSNLYYDDIVDPVDFDDLDRLSLDGSRLIVTSGVYWGTGAEYRFESENGMKVEPNGDGFKVYSPDGKISYYGSSNESKIWKPYGSTVQWFLDKVVDVFGNTIKIEYDQSSANGEFYVLPKKISYNYNPSVPNFTTAVYSVDFSNRAKANTTRKYLNTVCYKDALLIDTIKICKGTDVIEQYCLHYTDDFFVPSETIDTITLVNGEGTQKINPTKFFYTSKQNVTVDSTFITTFNVAGKNEDYIPGDFNGDGYTDLIRVNWIYDPEHKGDETDNTKVIEGFNLLINNKAGNFTLKTTPSNPNNVVGYNVPWTIHDGLYQIIPMNVNGDNKTDLVLFFDYDNKDYATHSWGDYEAKNKILVLISDGSEFTPVMNCLFPDVDLRIGQVIPADINGDGLDDLFFGCFAPWITDGSQNWQYCFLTHLNGDGVEFQKVSAFQGSSTDYNDYYNFDAINFDNDKKLEIVEIADPEKETNSSRIITFDPVTLTWSEVAGFTKWSIPLFGDFNGDGLSDMLSWTNTDFWDNEGGTWSVAYGTGNGFSYPANSVSFQYNYRPIPKPVPCGFWCGLLSFIGIWGEPEEHLACYKIGDYDGDGSDDVFESMKVSGTEMSKNNLFFSSGGISSEHKKSYYSSYFTFHRSYQYTSNIVDISGDNKDDLLRSINGDIRYFYYGKGIPEKIMTEAKDGLNNRMLPIYKTGKDGTIYANSSGDIYDNSLYNVFTSPIPIWAVYQLRYFKETEEISNESYKYYSGLVHRLGKGFLGFDKISVLNKYNNLHSLTKNKLFSNNGVYDYVIPETDYRVVFKDSEDNYLQRTEEDNTYSLFSDKRYQVTQTRQLSKSKDPNGYYTGTNMVEINFDTHCQPTLRRELKSITEHEIDAAEEDFEHRSVTSTYYKTPDYTKWIFSRPDSVTNSFFYKRPSSTVFQSKTFKTAFNYYGSSAPEYPLVQEIVQSSGSGSDPLAVKKIFTYNALGMVKKTTLSAPNYVPPAGVTAPAQRVTEKVYDPTRPYMVVSVKDPKNHTTQYEYDPYGLYVSKTTDVNGLVTTASTDILGVQSTTVKPEGTQQVSCIRWSKGEDWAHTDNPADGLYYTWSKTSGAAEVLTFYNQFGQELRTVACDVKGNKLYTDKTYDDLGRLSTETALYNPAKVTDLAAITTTYKYDLLNRVDSIVTSRGTSTIEYNGLETVFTDLLGHKTTKYVNAAGWLTESKDHSGASVKFFHNCLGEVVSTSHSANTHETEIINEYDTHGNCTKMIDPAAGTINFAYDPFDQMVTRKDSRQTTPSIFTYDVLGRMTSRTEPEGATTWTYDNQPHGLGQLGGVTFSGHNTLYSYDDFSRVSEVTNQINGINYTNKVSYDPYGRVARKEYPTGLDILSEYAANGQVSKLYKGGTNPGLIWEATGTDSYGRLNKTLYGNGATITSEYEPDRGLLTKQWATRKNNTEFFRREYDWNNGGNLNWRKRQAGLIAHTESFTYDNLDRLDVTMLDDVASGNNDYSSLGNIINKYTSQGIVLEDAQYGEDNRDPYAISSADVDPSLWPAARQDIVYNSYNKMTTVTEGNYQLNISYGYDHQRTCQELKQNGVVTKKKTFVGDGLEIIEKPGAGTVQKIHYLYAGDGNLFAMYVIDQNNEGKMYYIYTDHLGSPNLITDAECNVVQELSYDTWGNRRDPATWQPFTSTPVEPFIDRGFTFHEHLYPFTLINMNGRAYDPLVGRFLSADPYIQAPDNTQNLNRYSYCLNNPLKYSDPSGELFGIDDAILIQAAIYSAVAYLASAYNNRDKESGKWEWNPFKWFADDKPGVQVGVSSNLDGTDWSASAGTPGGLSVGYNNQKGWGLGYSDPNTGNTTFYYPGYNYGAVEQNAMNDYDAGRAVAIEDELAERQINALSDFDISRLMLRPGDQVMEPLQGFWPKVYDLFIEGRRYGAFDVGWDGRLNPRYIGGAGSLETIGGPVRKGQQVIKLGKYFFNPSAFHSVKQAFLRSIGPKSFASIVGHNPDIIFKGTQVFLTGAKNSPYYGKTLDTGRSIFDFLNLF